MTKIAEKIKLVKKKSITKNKDLKDRMAKISIIQKKHIKNAEKYLEKLIKSFAKKLAIVYK
jgi:hypothetical protein